MEKLAREKLLALAVIATAIADAVDPARWCGEDEDIRDAKWWLLSEDDHVCSFGWWCEVAELDKGYARRRVIEMLQSGKLNSRRRSHLTTTRFV
jgi:hypothetical protein